MSCRNHNTAPTNKQPQTPTQKSIIQFPALADSLDILFFKKPFTDKERYQRYFKILHVKDSVLVKTLNYSLQLEVVEDLLSPKKCMSEGKIILPLGGDAFKTIYFSRMETDCPYLYLIKDGHFLYYPMDTALNRMLNIGEKNAVEPLSY